MSTRFYPRQTDYIPQLNSMDDAVTLAISKGDLAYKWATQTSGEVVVGQGYSAAYYAKQASDAANVAIAGQIQSDWNQADTAQKDYIKNKPASAQTLLNSYGIGTTGTTPALSNIDDGTLGAGMYYANNTTIGTWPNGVTADVSWVLYRVYGSSGFQMLHHAVADRLFCRRRTANAWGTWAEVATSKNSSLMYAIPPNGATTGWTKLGTFSVTQQSGQTLKLEITGHNGYNSNPAQTQTTVLMLKVGNGIALDANGFSGDAWWYTMGAPGGTTAAPATIKIKTDAAGLSARSYEIWIDQSTYMDNSFYMVNTYGTGVWKDDAVDAVGQADPGSASATICAPPRSVPNFSGLTLLHNSNFNSYALPLSGGALSGDLTINANLYLNGPGGVNMFLSGTTPGLRLTETDQTGALGRWRIVADNGQWRLDRNTDTAGAFGTYSSDLYVTSTGFVNIPQLSVGTSITVPDRTALDNAANAANTKYVDTAVGGRLSTAGGTMTGALTLASIAPQVLFNETDQTNGAGKWRIVTDANTLRIDRNTATDGLYGTYQTCWQISSVGNLLVNAGTDDGSGNKLQVSGDIGASGSLKAVATLYAGYGTDGQVSIAYNDSNGALEIGKVGRVSAGTPYIDMHSSAGSGDFDVRMQASGGSSATSGQGNLNIQAASVQVNSIPVALRDNATLNNPTIKGYIEQFQSLNPGAAVTINTANGTLIEITTTANITITLPAPVAGASYSIIIAYGGAHTVTFVIASGTLTWATGSTPNATSVAGKKDVYSFISGATYVIGRDGGRGA